jgi:hypothetical protein
MESSARLRNIDSTKVGERAVIQIREREAGVRRDVLPGGDACGADAADPRPHEERGDWVIATGRIAERSVGRAQGQAEHHREAPTHL